MPASQQENSAIGHKAVISATALCLYCILVSITFSYGKLALTWPSTKASPSKVLDNKWDGRRDSKAASITLQSRAMADGRRRNGANLAL
jgi:hypothetical protein